MFRYERDAKEGCTVSSAQPSGIYRLALLSSGPKEILYNESRPDIKSLIGRKWFVLVVILGNSVCMKDDPEG